MRKIVNPSLLILVMSLFLLTCNKKKEGPCIHDEAALYITVIDNNGVKIGGAVINVFDNYSSYESAKGAKNDTSFATFTGFSNAATEAELLVSPYIEQWILVTYYDSIQQKYLSSENNFSVMSALQSCSDYYITVQLDPVGGVVSFWSPSAQNIPITVKFNGITDSLTGTTLTVPVSPSNPGEPQSLNFPVNAGTYSYQATSADGCSWQGEVIITDGQFIAIQLAPCERALVAFYFNSLSAIPTDKQNITIFIDNNPVAAGTLTGMYSGAPITNSCQGSPVMPNILYVYMEPGVAHTYKAETVPGSNSIPCIWTGTTSVLSTDCNLNPPVYLNQGCF